MRILLLLNIFISKYYAQITGSQINNTAIQYATTANSVNDRQRWWYRTARNTITFPNIVSVTEIQIFKSV